MRRTAAFALVFVLVAVLSACGGRAQLDEPGSDEPTVLEVDNGATLDMTIYVLRDSDRRRLGTATAHRVSRFTIPSTLVFGATQLRFQADPIGAREAPITRTISVVPGDTIQMTIPPF